MTTFLNMVAQDLYRKTDGELQDIAVVFPNKRASLFFNECLAKYADHPIWTPEYLSIKDLFGKLSDLKTGDPIQLVCELYKVFKQETGSEETLDDFCFWGELLIADFDDVDKNLVNARQLFANLKDLKEIMNDGESFLNEEQIEAIRQFFQNFSVERRTELKERFISLWDKLGDVYHAFRRQLEQLGIAYEGMMYRQALEHLDLQRLPAKRYVFIGFNVLNQVETKFFKCLQNAGRAWFYWDYDVAYTRIPRTSQPPYVHEAGEFIERNLSLFPNQLPESCFDALNKEKNITFIASSTENAQVRFLPQWYGALPKDKGIKEKENAIVLCNESLLPPILHALPDEVKEVNITMGFPLSQTPVYAFVHAWLDMQTEGYHPDSGRYTYDTVLAVLRHPYTRKLSEKASELERQLVHDNRFYPLPSELKADPFLEQLFTPSSSIAHLCHTLTELLGQMATLYRKTGDSPAQDFKSQLYQESLFKAYTLTGRLYGLVKSGDLAGISSRTLCRLLDRLLTSATIPFHGEPAAGLQVMGVLETRNLDFRNLAILSLNEGKLPKSEGESSFIPHNLRKAFGMTTIEHKNAVYAYYFYRLIQRAENITLLYNTSSDGLNRGEMSRFMRQLQVEYPHPIRQLYLESSQAPQASAPFQVNKTPEMLAGMWKTYDTRNGEGVILSPSALNAYLDCPLSFYYRYVARLSAPDEVNPEIDSALFGTIFHRAAELAYGDLTRHGKDIRKEDLEQLLRNQTRIEAYVDQAFCEKFFHLAPGRKPEYNGTQLIHAKVISSYLRQLLRNDLEQAPFRMEGMEQRVYEDMEVNTATHGVLSIRIGGTIDRMDSKGGILRIVDYKTGGTPKTPNDIPQLFQPDEARPAHVFQAFLYAFIMCRKQSLKVAPALLYIHRAATQGYSPIIEMGPARQKTPVEDFSLYEDEFHGQLTTLLQAIFNIDEPFTQTGNESRCAYCDYRRLCRR